MQGKDRGQSRPLRQYPTEFAMPPAAHEGVSRALRDAYALDRKGLPSDWRALLERLN